MATKREIGLWVLKLSPIVIVPIALFALEPWISEEITIGFPIVLMGYCLALAASVNRRLDEVQITGQRIAQTKGMTIGTVAALLVIIFPPSIDALIDLAETIAAGSADKAIRIGVVIGFMLVVVLQTLAMFAVSIWWERRVYGHE